MDISLTDLEEAINYWRRQRPATGEECALSPEVNALADIYARMIFGGIGAVPLDALEAGQRQLITSWQLQRQQA
ncbi:DUF3717 domain-containing protein [Oxalobacteraceae bacterium CAVE-383]|nr:DUF3717 domain-containing protein [Oxalobacteraceae bacterium CAVE-383]